MKTVKTSIGTVRRNTVKARLILFSVLAIALIVCSFFSEYLTPYDPYLQNLDIAKQAPTKAHPLGTDRYGRDMLSRVIAGSRASVFSTLLLVTVTAILGTAVGVLCGWVGGMTDTVFMRVSDVFLAFPGLVFALAVAGTLGGGLQNAMIALAAISWPKYARIARSLTLSQKETQWMKAVRLSGSSTGSWAAGTLQGIRFAPSASRRTISACAIQQVSCSGGRAVSLPCSAGTPATAYCPAAQRDASAASSAA